MDCFWSELENVCKDCRNCYAKELVGRRNCCTRQLVGGATICVNNLYIVLFC